MDRGFKEDVMNLRQEVKANINKNDTERGYGKE